MYPSLMCISRYFVNCVRNQQNHRPVLSFREERSHEPAARGLLRLIYPTLMCSLYPPDPQLCRKLTHHIHGKSKWRIQTKRHRRSRSGLPGVLGASSGRNRSELLNLNFGPRVVELALDADALAIELLDLILMVDVVSLSGIIFQHVLVARLGDGARESLAV